MRDLEDEPAVNLQTTTDWWTSTTSNPHMFSPKYQTSELRDLLLDRVGIDSAQIAIEASQQHVRRHEIEAFQRKLGLRKISRRRDPLK